MDLRHFSKTWRSFAAVALALSGSIAIAAADVSKEHFSTNVALSLDQSANSNSFYTISVAPPSSLRRDLFHESLPSRKIAVRPKQADDALAERYHTGLAHPASLDTLRLDGQNMTLTASGNVVMKLEDLVLVGGTLTLEGTAETKLTIYIADTFSLERSAKITLAGDLQPTNVVFCLIGRGDTVSLRQQSTLAGIIEAHQRFVTISGKSTVFGQVDTKWVKLSGDGTIIPPPIVSP